MDDLLESGTSFSNFDNKPKALPNATAVLVLGIISIAGCVLYAVPGLVCGIIALMLHRRDKLMYDTNPARYEDSFKTSKAGYVCAIVGTSISALFLLVMVLWLIFVGTMISSMARIH